MAVFAHAGENHGSSTVDSSLHLLQNWYVAVPVMTLIALGLTLLGIYLLKHYGAWRLISKRKD